MFTGYRIMSMHKIMGKFVLISGVFLRKNRASKKKKVFDSFVPGQNCRTPLLITTFYAYVGVADIYDVKPS